MPVLKENASAYLAAIVESSEDAIIAKDLDGVIQWCNAGAERLFGYAAAELVGRPVNVLIPSELQSQETDILHHIRRGERVGHFDTVRIAKGARRLDVSLSVSPVRDASGAVIGASKIARDISDRKKADRLKANLAAIVESSDDSIVMTDLQSTMLSCNSGAERLYGYTAAEMIGRKTAMLVPDGRAQEDEDILRRILEGERVRHFETVRKTKSGALVDVSVTVSPVRDTTGAIVGVSRITRDITEKKRAAEALAAQREWFRVTLASIGDAVIATDNTGRVTYLNEVAQTLTGWVPNEARGRSLESVFHILGEKTREPMPDPAARVLKEGCVVGLGNHTTLVSRDGSEYPIDDSAAPIRDDNGKVIGVVIVFHDVTAQRRAQDALARSEERLNRTMEATRLGSWDWNVESGAFEWSSRCREIFDVPSDEPSYQGFLEALHPDDRDRVERIVRRALDAELEGDFEAEARAVRADGQVRWVELRGRALHAEGAARPGRVSGTCLDVTARHHAMDARHFVEQAAILLASSLDERETLAGVARAAVPRLADWCGVEVVGEDGALQQVATEHVDPAKRDQASVFFGQRRGTSAARGHAHDVETGESLLIEEIGAVVDDSTDDGQLMRMLRGLELRTAMIVPMVARGRTVGVITFASGEPGRYRAADLAMAEELAVAAGLALDNARLFGEARAAVREREELLAVVSHELRSPLSTIVMGTALLRQSWANQEQGRRQVEAIERSARRMERLLGDLLEVASIHAGRLDIETSIVEGEALVSDAVEAIAPVATEKGVAVTTDVRIPCARLSCDRERMLQVFSNLLGNAVKFCAPGARVSVSADASDQAIRFSITDTGPGIPAEDIPRLFEPYWSGRRDVRKGTGLGLYIVKRILDAHGSSIEVESRVGLGTTFRFALPVADPQEDAGKRPPTGPA